MGYITQKIIVAEYINYIHFDNGGGLDVKCRITKSVKAEDSYPYSLDFNYHTNTGADTDIYIHKTNFETKEEAELEMRLYLDFMLIGTKREKNEYY